MKKMISTVIFLIGISLLLAACDETAMGNIPADNGSPMESGNEVTGGSDAITGEDTQTNSPSDTGMPGEGQVIVVTPAYTKGNSARLNVGDLLIIELPSIPTEGWTWVPEDLDTSVLEQIGEAEYTPGSDPNDAGGIYRLQFRAVGPGKINIGLLYVNYGSATGSPEVPMSSDSFGMEVEVIGGRTVVVTPAVKGNSARLNVGDLLVIEIPTIPAEGWTWVAEGLDTRILEQSGDTVYIAGTDPNDAGGIYRLMFTAVGSGSTNLTLLYVNASQGDGPSLSSNSFGMEVIVN